MPKGLTAAERLAQLMDDRRLELGMTWTGVATEGKTTAETLRQARAGSPISKLSKAAIERGLKWARGSVDRILEGGDPQPVFFDVGGPSEDDEIRYLRPPGISDREWEIRRRAAEATLKGLFEEYET